MKFGIGPVDRLARAITFDLQRNEFSRQYYASYDPFLARHNLKPYIDSVMAATLRNLNDREAAAYVQMRRRNVSHNDAVLTLLSSKVI